LQSRLRRALQLRNPPFQDSSTASTGPSKSSISKTRLRRAFSASGSSLSCLGSAQLRNTIIKPMIAKTRIASSLPFFPIIFNVINRFRFWWPLAWSGLSFGHLLLASQPVAATPPFRQHEHNTEPRRLSGTSRRHANLKFLFSAAKILPYTLSTVLYAARTPETTSEPHSHPATRRRARVAHDRQPSSLLSSPRTPPRSA
jgi:hypothetical protein